MWSTAYTVLFCTLQKLGSLLRIISYVYRSDNVIHKKITQVTVEGALIDTGNDIVRTYTYTSRHCRIDWDQIFQG